MGSRLLLRLSRRWCEAQLEKEKDMKRYQNKREKGNVRAKRSNGGPWMIFGFASAIARRAESYVIETGRGARDSGNKCEMIEKTLDL